MGQVFEMYMKSLIKTFKDGIANVIRGSDAQNLRTFTDYKNLTNNICEHLLKYEQKLFREKFEHDLWSYAVLLFLRSPQKREDLEQKIFSFFQLQRDSMIFVQETMKTIMKEKLSAFERSLIII